MMQETPARPPLELIVHPSTDHTHRPGMGVLIRCPGCIADRKTQAQRFTDVELAAEVFRAAAWLGAKGRTFTSDEGRNVVIAAAFTFGPITRDEYEFQVIQRFLTLPSHDSRDLK
jgi:hypothetical protein